MSKSLSTAVRNKNITTIFAGAAALTLVGGGALIFVMNDRITAARVAEANLETQVGSSEQVAKRLQSTQDAYDQTRAKIAFLETTVSQKSYVPTLLQQLQTLATSTRLSVTSVQPSPITSPAAPAAPTDGSAPKKVAAPAYETMALGLNVTGSYADTQQFLYGLTHFPKVISVTSIQMSPGAVAPPSTPGAPTQAPTAAPVSTTLRLTAYVFPDDGTQPAVAAGTPVPAAGGAATVAVVPPPAAPTLAGAAGRASQGAIAATQAANAHGSAPASAL